jgi:hypothetical protein
MMTDGRHGMMRLMNTRLRAVAAGFLRNCEREPSKEGIFALVMVFCLFLLGVLVARGAFELENREVDFDNVELPGVMW